MFSVRNSPVSVADLGHRVARRAALDGPDAERRLLVEPPLREPRDDLRGDADGRYAVLRLDARMSGSSRDGEVVGDVRRTREGDSIDRPLAVEDDRLPRPHLGEIELVRADQARLLLSRQDDLDRNRRSPVLPHRGESFEDDRQPRVVVAAADGRPVRGDPVAVLDGLDPVAGGHRIEVA